MRELMKVTVVAVLVGGTGFYSDSSTGSAASAQRAAATALGPASIGPLTFAADGTLFAADTTGASIYAFDLGAHGASTATGAATVEAIDQKLAATLGTTAGEIQITDLAVHPRSSNAFVSVMRAQGAGGAPALFRIDGAGAISLVPLQTLKSTTVALPNAPAGGASAYQEMQRRESITDMEFVNNQLWVAGLSNEEFSSKLRGIPYPFKTADAGTSVEIYHGNHGAWETDSPVYSFVQHTINGTPHLIAGYLCTPLVKFPVSALKPGSRVRGTTIAELGNMNRPIDMIVYTKGGTEFLLMSNNARGVMKMPTASFANASPIASVVRAETAGVKYETVGSMRGITELDRLDGERAIAIARGPSALDLRVMPLP